MPVDALRDADEAFLSSTVREVQPIAHRRRRRAARPRPARSPNASPPRFTDLVARDLDP